jgi:hypothetical protein
MGLPPEMWSESVCSTAAIGDMFIVFEPAKEDMLNANLRELTPSGFVLIHSKDNDFPMSYWLDEEKYELGFMEGVISTHAGKANSSNNALFCLRLSPKQEISEDIKKNLAKLAKEYGGAGQRDPDDKVDLMDAYLSAVKLALDLETDAPQPTIEEIAEAFWDQAGLPSLKNKEAKTKQSSRKPRKKQKAEEPPQKKETLSSESDSSLRKQESDRDDLSASKSKQTDSINLNSDPAKAELKSEDPFGNKSKEESYLDDLFGAKSSDSLFGDEPKAKAKSDDPFADNGRDAGALEADAEGLFKDNVKDESRSDSKIEPSTNLFAEEPKSESESESKSKVEDLVKEEPESRSKAETLFKEEPGASSAVDDLFKDEPKSETNVEDLVKERSESKSKAETLFKEEPGASSAVDDLFKDEPKSETNVEDLVKERSESKSKAEDLFKEGLNSGSAVDDLFNDEPKAESKDEELVKEEPDEAKSKTEDLVKEESEPKSKAEDLFKEGPDSGSAVDDLFKDEPKAESKAEELVKEESKSESKVEEPPKEGPDSGSAVDDLFKGEPKAESKVEDLVKEESKSESKAADLFKEGPGSGSAVDDLFKDEPKAESKVEDLIKEEPKSESKVEELVKEEPKSESKVEELVKEEPKSESKVEELVKEEPKSESKVEDEKRERVTEDAKDIFGSSPPSPFDSMNSGFGSDIVFSDRDPLGDLFADMDKVAKANSFGQDRSDSKTDETIDSSKSNPETKAKPAFENASDANLTSNLQKDGANEADLLADLFSRTSKSEQVLHSDSAAQENEPKTRHKPNDPFASSEDKEADFFNFSKPFDSDDNIGSLFESPTAKSAKPELEPEKLAAPQNPFKHDETEKTKTAEAVPDSDLETIQSARSKSEPENKELREQIPAEEKEAPKKEQRYDEAIAELPSEKEPDVPNPQLEIATTEHTKSEASTGTFANSQLPEDMTAIMKNRLNEQGFKLPGTDNVDKLNKLNTTSDDESDSMLKAAAEEKLVAETPGMRQDRKPVSLDATLRKLDEQKKAAFEKIEQFTTLHETTCIEKISALLPEKRNLDNSINFEVLKRRETVISKLKADTEAAQTKLKDTVANYKSQLNTQLDSLNSFIESAKTEAGIYKHFNQMDQAADSFANNYKTELVQLLDSNIGEALGEHTKKELNKLREWNKNKIEEHTKFLELTLEQIKNYCSNSESSLDDLVNSKCHEIQRLCDQQLETLELHEQRLSDAAVLREKSAEQQYKRTLQKLLAEHGLPFQSEQQTRAREMMHSLVQAFSQELESRALDSLKEINVTLEQNKQRLSAVGIALEEQRDAFDQEARQQLKEQLSKLSEHLDDKFAELKEFFAILDSEDSTSQKRIIKRIKHIRQIGMAIITAANEKELLAVRKLMDSTGSQWNQKASLELKQLKDELTKNLNGYRNRRSDPAKQLEEKLERLTQLVESISPDYL